MARVTALDYRRLDYVARTIFDVWRERNGAGGDRVSEVRAPATFGDLGGEVVRFALNERGARHFADEARRIVATETVEVPEMRTLPTRVVEALGALRVHDGLRKLDEEAGRVPVRGVG